MAELIVMRLADMHRVHPQQDDSRVCVECGEQVGIYPSGQSVLERFPDTRIICSHCWKPDNYDAALLAPGAREEVAESVSAKKERDH